MTLPINTSFVDFNHYTMLDNRYGLGSGEHMDVLTDLCCVIMFLSMATGLAGIINVQNVSVYVCVWKSNGDTHTHTHTHTHTSRVHYTLLTSHMPHVSTAYKPV